MGYIFMTLAALMFGLNGSVTKVVVETGMSPAVLTFYRVLGTAVIAGVALLVSNRGAFRITWARLAVMTLLGVAGVALMQFAYAAALALLPVGIVLLFQYTAVLMIPLVAFFILRQGVRTRLWIAVALVIVGLAVVAQVWASALNPFGIALALVAAIALAIYYLVGERVLSTTPPLAVAFWTMLFASAFWA